MDCYGHNRYQSFWSLLQSLRKIHLQLVSQQSRWNLCRKPCCPSFRLDYNCPWSCTCACQLQQHWWRRCLSLKTLVLFLRLQKNRSHYRCVLQLALCSQQMFQIIIWFAMNSLCQIEGQALVPHPVWSPSFYWSSLQIRKQKYSQRQESICLNYTSLHQLC